MPHAALPVSSLKAAGEMRPARATAPAQRPVRAGDPARRAGTR
jgi:hypothetical protein